MAQPQHTGDLEVDEDMAHQRKVWVIERISWLVMAAIILSAMLGLLGKGPLSSVVLNEPDTGLSMQYNRFERHKTTALITASLVPEPDRRARLSIARNFFDEYQLENVVPEPAAVETWQDRLVYEFVLPDQEGSADILFYVSPVGFGPIDVSMTLEGYRELRFGQFIYP